MRPFFDQAIQFGPDRKFSLFFRILTTLAGSTLLYGLATLQTRRSPSLVCTANMSDFWRDDEACHDTVTIGDGALEVLRLCKIVNLGCSVAIKSDPFWYLHAMSAIASSETAQFYETHPMANVRQSAAGAIAVTAIWSIVLEEMCSHVCGSKRVMLPCVFPVACSVRSRMPGYQNVILTEGDVSVAHPRSNCEIVIRDKASDLVPSHKIPNDGCLACVITDDKPSRATLALVVHSQQLHLLLVARESPLDRQGIVVAADN